MCRLLLIVFFLRLTASNLFSQTVYNRLIDLGSNEVATGILNHDAATKAYTFFGNVTDTVTHLTKLFVCKTDSLLQVNKYYVIGTNDTFDLYSGNNDQFTFGVGKTTYMLVTYLHKQVSQFHRLYLFNTTNDTIGSYQVNLPKSSKILLVKYYQGKIYYFGMNGPFTDSKLYIACTDTLGNFLWDKVYTHTKRPISASLSADSCFFVSGFYSNDGGNWKDVTGWLAKIGLSGSIIWEQFGPDSLGMQGGDNGGQVILYQNDIYVLGNYSKRFENSYVYLYKSNEKGSPITNSILLFGNYHPMIDLTACELSAYVVWNGYIYACGRLDLPTETGDDYTTFIQFVKLDFEGNVVWRRLYKSNYHSGSYSTTITNTDNGFLILGSAIDTNHVTGPRDILILKTDINGCIDPNCINYTGVRNHANESDMSILIFPNPVNNNCTIEAGKGNTIDEVLVYENTGKLVLHPKDRFTKEVRVDTSELKDGTYVLCVKYNKSLRAYRKLIVRHE